jgi:hypothetical protein
MNEWVLIIALSSGNVIPVEMPNKAACQQAKLELQGACVTMDHWTGKKRMGSELTPSEYAKALARVKRLAGEE